MKVERALWAGTRVSFATHPPIAISSAERTASSHLFLHSLKILKMNPRKIIFNLIPFFLFLLYLYIVSSNFFKYQTVTDVSQLKYRNETPEIVYTFCIQLNNIRKADSFPQYSGQKYSEDQIAKLSALTMNSSELESHISFSISNKSVRLIGDPFYYQFFKCWLMEYNQSDMIIEETFVISPTFDLFESGALIRRDFPNRIQTITEPFTTFADRWSYYTIVDFMLIDLMKPPYDTDCYDYYISQADCKTECLNLIYKSNRLDTKEINSCIVECKKKDCLLIYNSLRRGSYDMESSLNDDQMIFVYGDENMLLKTNPMFPPSLFIQQVVGLITMFFELCALDVADKLRVALNKLIRMGKCMRKSFQRKLRYCLRSALKVIIVTFCYAHIVFSILDYMKYKTSNEAFFGSSNKIPNVNVMVCITNSNIDKISNDTIGIFYADNTTESTMYRYDYNGLRCVTAVPLQATSSTDSRTYIEVFVHGIYYLKVYIRLHDTKPIGPSIPRLDGKIVETYRVVMIDRYNLEHPYATDCYNYHRINLSSRLDCMYSCGYNRTTLFYDDVLWRKLQMKCIQTCSRLDCRENRIDVLSSDRYRPLEDIAGAKILPPKYSISIHMFPFQSRIDFITYTASILALWLGISGMNIVGLLNTVRLGIIKQIGLKNIVYISLLVGCYTHFGMVLDGYLKYEISSHVTVGHPNTVSPPAISLSFEMSTIGTIGNNTRRMFLAEPITPHSRLSMGNHSEIFRIQVINASRYQYDVLTMEDVVNVSDTYIWANNKLLTIGLNQLKQRDYVYDWGIVKRAAIVHVVRNDIPRTEDTVPRFRFIEIILHNHRYPGDLRNRIPLVPNYELVYSDEIITKSLKYPYSANCIDYVDPLQSNDSPFRCRLDRHIAKTRKNS